MSDHNSDDLNAKPAANGADHLDASMHGPQQPQDMQAGAANAAAAGPASEHGQSGEAPKADAAASAAETGAPRGSSHIMVLPPSRNRDWKGSTIDDESSARSGAKSSVFGKRRASALAAIFVLAAVAGVIGGSLATAAFGHYLASNSAKTASNQSSALEESIRRIGADVAALKSGMERSSKLDNAQFSKVNDRIEKIEKAQAEPAAKLAKISETLEKLRVAAATPAATQAAAKETTGSIPTPTPAPKTVAANKPEPSRMPTIEGWRIRDVANGGALLEGREGLYEVYAGDPLPGVGRVDAIRRQDGRWVVVTSRGLIVAR